MMRRVAGFVLLVAVAWGQNDQRRKQNPELFHLAERAQTVSAEFASSTLLRVAGSSTMTDWVWKKDLIDEAFRFAGMARNPIRKKIMNYGMNQGNIAGMMSMAYAQKLDRLSLESQAVMQMLAVDPKRAREMFFRIQLPRMAQLTCSDALLEDPSDYYEALALVSAGAFGNTLRERDAQLDWLNASIQRITSAVEIPLMGNALLRAGVTPEQMAVLLTTFAGALDRIRGDDRAFSSSLGSIDTVIRKLSSNALLVSYRAFLVSHLIAPRCAESSMMVEEVENLVNRFNTQYANANNPSLAVLNRVELKPSSVGDSAKLELLFDKPEFQSIHYQFTKLFLGTGNMVLTDEQKYTPEWKERFQDYNTAIVEMKPATGESEATFFHRKGQALAAALTVVPSGPERDKAVMQYIAFLQNSNMQTENFLVWFDQVVRLAESTRSLRAAEHLKFLDVLEATGHPVLALYALRERTLGSRPQWAN